MLRVTVTDTGFSFLAEACTVPSETCMGNSFGFF